jgi:hypothetical protein
MTQFEIRVVLRSIIQTARDTEHGISAAKIHVSQSVVNKHMSTSESQRGADKQDDNNNKVMTGELE